MNGMTDKPSRVRRIVGWIVTSLAILWVSALSILLLSEVSCAINGRKYSLFGHQMRRVLSGSMEGSSEFYADNEFDIEKVPTGSIVFIREIPRGEQARQEWYAALKIGTILSFEYDWPELGNINLMHRVIGVEYNETETLIHLQGDAPQAQDEMQTISSQDDVVIGDIIGQSRVLGEFVGFIQSGWGFFILIVAMFVLLFYDYMWMMFSPYNQFERLRRNINKE